MTRIARAGTTGRIWRGFAHPGCTAAALVILYVVLMGVGADRAARILVLVVSVLTVLPVFAVLLLTPPLPKLHAKSLLTERLAWLWRFAVASFLLCAAGVLSVYFSHEFTRQDDDVAREVRLLTAAMEVAEGAATLAVFIILVWLVVDLARLRAGSRAVAVAVALRKLRLRADGQLARWAAFVTRPWWVLLVLVVLLDPLVHIVIDLGE